MMSCYHDDCFEFKRARVQSFRLGSDYLGLANDNNGLLTIQNVFVALFSKPTLQDKYR